MEDEVINKLVDAAFEAKCRSYSPYSRFRVGAALLTADDNTIITGCNVENTSLSSTICAEKCAIVAAIARGYRTFKAIAITGDLTDTPIVPCGGCRQFMAEFGQDWLVYMTRSDKSYEVVTVKQLLPLFELKTQARMRNGGCSAGANPPSMVAEAVEETNKKTS